MMPATTIRGLLPPILGVLACVLFFAHVTGLRNFLATLPTLLVLAVLIKERHLPEPFWWVLPWLALCFASALWSVNPGRSFGDAATSVLLPIACGLAAYVSLNRENILRWVVYPILAGLASILLVRFIYMSFSVAPAWIEKLYAYWPGRGVMSTLAILLLPLGAWLVVTGKRFLGALLIVLTLVAGTQNWNRMFWLAVFFTLIPCIFMVRLKRWVWISILVASLLATGGGTLYAIGQIIPGQSASQAFRNDARWPIWKAWSEVAAEKPWLGHGYGMRATNQVGEEKQLPEALGYGRDHPHNTLFAQAIQTGGLGLMLFLVAMGGLILVFASRLRAADRRAAAMGGIAVIIGLIAKNLTDDFFYHSVAIMFWLQIGVFLRLVKGDDD